MLSQQPFPAQPPRTNGTSGKSIDDTDPQFAQHPVPNYDARTGDKSTIAGASDHAPRSSPMIISAAVTQEEDDLLDDRPSKRARFDIDLVSSPLQDESIVKTKREALPFPEQPKRPRYSRQGKSASIDLASRRADDTKPPAIAVALPGGVTADFHPWTGQHAEDIINEQAIKGGYSDKGPSPNQNECNSARVTVWPYLTLKNNVALQTLSIIYTQVLDRRQSAGKVTAPSSFKFPPRVTVPDTKREAWLRDLANPAIPLKRQSRTIPHGIRGKVLLDQCLLKNIPLQRAVWLVKCVGANELRAFRKKGVSGSASSQAEAKWIREWSMNVIQFLGDAMRTAPGDGWRSRIEYAIKLVAVLFSESLLESSYFLDWLVSSVEHASLDVLPIWLLPVRIFWKHLTALEQRGRRLSLAILQHLDAAAEPKASSFAPMKAQLENLVCAFALRAPACLVIPTQWAKYAGVVLESFHRLPTHLRESVHTSINLRNQRLASPSAKTISIVTSPAQRLYAMLDAVTFTIDITQLVQQAQTLISDIAVLITALLDWATSSFRTGPARALVICRMLVDLASNGFDITGSILSFLSKAGASHIHLSEANIVTIIRRLTTAGHFFVGSYMQWLITSGMLSSAQDRALVMQILVGLPVEQLSQHLLNTRSVLLARMGYATSMTEVQLLERLTLHLLQDVSIDQQLGHALKDQALIGSVSKWVTSQALRLCKDGSLTATRFCFLRQVLETTAEIDTLQQLLQMAALSDDFKIIGAAADTVSRHAYELAAIDALSSLTQALVERYRSLRKQQPLERSSIYALRSLVKAQNGSIATIGLFNNDIAVYEQQNLNSVCSPASDNLIGMQADTLDSDDEIEAVFASGNTMDENLMRRVLARIAQRAQQAVKSGLEQSAICRWLVQLRMLDRLAFDKITAEYAVEKLSSPDHSMASYCIYALIAADCFGFETLTSLFDDNTDPRIASNVLELITGPMPDLMALGVHEFYHLEQQRSSFHRSQPAIIARFLQRSLAVPPLSQTPEFILRAARNMHQTDLFRQITVTSQDNHTACQNLYLVCTAIFETSRAAVDGTAMLTASEVAGSANALNIGICTGWLQCTSTLSQGDEDMAKDALGDAIQTAAPAWPQLLQAASQTSLDSACDWALMQLIKCEGNDADRDLAQYSSILDMAADKLRPEVQSAGLGQLAVRLRALSKVLGSVDCDTANAKAVLKLIPYLLHAVLVFSQSTPRNEATVQSCTQAVLALCSLTALQRIQEQQSILELTHDLTSQVIDKLPSEALPRLLRGLANAGLYHDSFDSLLGTLPDHDTWLALASQCGGAQPKGMLSRQSTGLNTRAATAPTSTASPEASQPSKTPAQGVKSATQPGDVSIRYAAYAPQPWEVMRDAAPVIGENDSSLNLSLFGARTLS